MNKDNIINIIEEEIRISIDKREELNATNIKKAQYIGYKNIPDKIVLTDEFGFMKDKKDVKKENILRANARLEKWNTMMMDYNNYHRKNFNTLKKRTRKGIPDCLRGQVWQLYAEIFKYRDDITFKDLYYTFVNDENSDEKTESTILRDIERTFPKHFYFSEKYGKGQRSLYNVLRSYAKFNEATGYVQGMGFLAAIMLTYMDEESTFWMIHSLMLKYNMKGYYMNGFPELNRSFYKLLCLMKKHLNKIYEKFKLNNVYPSMYACQWFISIFSVNFKFDILVRIFDVFLLEGEKIFYRIALAILKLNEGKILNKNCFEYIMAEVKSFYENIDVEELLKIGFGFYISRNHLIEYDKQYDIFLNNKDHEIIKQVIF